jgi:hypothetical protein
MESGRGFGRLAGARGGFAPRIGNFTKVAEAKIGKWSQGVVWSGDGKTLLVQSMVENLLSVLSFDGNSLKVMGEIKVKGGPEGLRTSEH